MSAAPAQKPGRSKQDYRTPLEFLEAVRRRLGITDFGIDLAADSSNAVTEPYYGPGGTVEDALSEVATWIYIGWGWLNPPFGHLEPWVKRAWQESKGDAKIAMLVPAGVGANWWRDWVHGKASVLFLNGRLSFDGVAPYPKDTALLLYSRLEQPLYEVWDWRKQP